MSQGRATSKITLLHTYGMQGPWAKRKRTKWMGEWAAAASGDISPHLPETTRWIMKSRCLPFVFIHVGSTVDSIVRRMLSYRWALVGGFLEAAEGSAIVRSLCTGIISTASMEQRSKYPYWGSRRTSALVLPNIIWVGRNDRGVGSVGWYGST